MLNVLELGRLDADKLCLGTRIVQYHSASHILNINRPVNFPGPGLDLLENERQKLLHERFECFLQSLADSLGCRQAILHDRVILTLLGLRCCNQHCVQNRYCILIEALLGHGVCQQREALKALPEQLSLLSVVGSQPNHLGQCWDQYIVIFAEPFLCQSSNHCNSCDCSAHDGFAAILVRCSQHVVELVHQWIHPRFHVHLVDFLCEMSESFHAMNRNTRCRILEPLQKQRQHLSVVLFHEPGLVVFRDGRDCGPGCESQPRVLRGFNHLHDDGHTLADVVGIFQILDRLLNRGQGRILALPSWGRQAGLNVAQDHLENHFLILDCFGDAVQHFSTIVVQLLFIVVIFI
mmetsp:Transcript_39696/g.95318  ORF Transcript_39696/g.95318 Transcript_39696/m.95318 type:complete len:349 (+) Transcript_39696:1455-2501(+)